MRLIYDNLIDRSTTTLSASSTAGGMVVDSLKSNRKGLVWRSVGTTADLTVDLQTAEFISAVVVPCCNLTSSAEMRVTVFNGAVQEYDSGWVPANPPGAFGGLNWGFEPLGVNHYAYAEQQVYAYHWFPDPHVGDQVVVELRDPTNSSDYLEASRLVVGAHWEPEITADLGVTLGVSDSSRQTRTDSGDLVTTLGPRSKTLSFSLGALLPEEGQRLRAMLLSAGYSKPIFVSLYPNNSDPSKEQAFQLFGKLTRASALKLTHFNNTASSIELEEL